jgi:hypothetical protein
VQLSPCTGATTAFNYSKSIYFTNDLSDPIQIDLWQSSFIDHQKSSKHRFFFEATVNGAWNHLF